MGNKYFTSERLEYRPYTMDDLEILHKQFNEQSRRRWFYFQEPDCLTIEFAINEIEKNAATWARDVDILKDQCGLAIVLKETNELIGYICVTKFHGPQDELDNVEIGYQITEAHQGKGYATEATKAATEWAIARLREAGAEPKVVGKVEHENWPSRKVLENAGYKFVCAEKYVSVYEKV